MSLHGIDKLLSDVPIAPSVKVYEAEIVPVDLANRFSTLEYLTSEKVLRLLLYVAHLVPAGDPVLFVCEFNFAYYLMIECADEGIIEHVALIIISNLSSIFEGNGL
jgi:hypothetical protein